MALAHARTSRRVVLPVRRQDVTEIAAVGAMWFIRTADHLYVTHVGWYPQFCDVDIAAMRALLVEGWRKDEVAARWNVNPPVIVELFLNDPEVWATCKRRAAR